MLLLRKVCAFGLLDQHLFAALHLGHSDELALIEWEKLHSPSVFTTIAPIIGFMTNSNGLIGK